MKLSEPKMSSESNLRGRKKSMRVITKIDVEIEKLYKKKLVSPEIIHSVNKTDPEESDDYNVGFKNGLEVVNRCVIGVERFNRG